MRPLFVRLALVVASLAVALHANIGVGLQLQTGNPSGATADPNNQNRFLIERAQYSLDFSNNLGDPNWVAWNLTSGDVGSSGRSNFLPDPGLPAGFYAVVTSDYTGSGYDRGHMCPSADRTVSSADNQIVFYMTNIVPQTADNNQGPWAAFETYCRSLASAGNELLIITGPSGFAGSRIPSGKAAIPGYVWKIVLVVPTGAGTAASRVDANTRVIALKMPNIAGIRSNTWQSYITSASQIETDTGLTFFSSLNSTVATALRAKIDGQTSTGAPTITTQPVAQSSPVGGNATFSVIATGNATLTYQWLKDDETIAGATNASLTLTNIQVSDGANYTVVITNSIGSVTSADAELVITGLAPTITTAPTAKTAAAGSTATFSVVASGSPTLTYQWRKAGTNLTNGGNISGATLPILTLTNVQAAVAANYDVVVSNSVNPAATSTAVALTVTPSAPTITTPPTTQTVTTGSTATLTVAATGTAPLTYQWRKGGTNLTNGGNISGATSATLTLTNAVTGDSGSYDVVVSNGINPDATSAAATLTVSASSASSVVTWDFATATPTTGLPTDVTGGTVTQNNNNGTTTMITTTSASSGYTGASGTNNAGAAARTGALNTGASGSAYFEVTLTPASGKQLVISAINFGSRSTSTGPQAYDIFSSLDNYGTRIATGTLANNSSYALITPTFTSLTSSTGTAITLRLFGYNGTGSASANTANWRIDDLKITVNTIAAAPTVPALNTSTPAASATGVAANTTIALTFNQAVNVTDGWFTLTSATSGALAATVTGGPTSYTLTPPANLAFGDTITVKLVADKITDQATSALKPAADTTFSFTVITPTAPSITNQPAAQTASPTGSASFTVVAAGTAPLSYQWRKNGAAITGNGTATTATLNLTGLQTADAANYDVVITNLVGSITSNAVTLTVNPLAPTITAQPVAQFAITGGTVSFTVAATGSTPFTYQWRKGGTAIAGNTTATTATLTLANVAAADAANYDVVVSNGTNPAATSNAVALTINPTAALVITWDFTATTGAPASGLPSDVTGAIVSGNNNNGTVSTPINTTSASGSYTGATGGGNIGTAARIGALDKTAGTGSAYFEFTLTPATGRQLQVSSFSFGSRSTSTGPQGYSLFSSRDNFAAPLATGTFANDSVWRLTTAGFAAFTTAPDTGVTFRLYGHSGTGSPGSGTINWRIDDLKVGVTTIVVSPVITTQPVAQTVTSGSGASLSVAGTSTSTLTYQWRKNGANLSGATSATLALTSLNVADSGTYDCVLTNSFASTTSNGAALLVNPIEARISLAGTRVTYDGTPKAITATTNPAGLALSINYGGGSAPTDAGSYIVTATVTTPNYSGSTSAILAIGKADQTVAFRALPATVVSGVPFTVAATSSAGLPVAITITTGDATIAGDLVTVRDSAPVTLRATQAGNNNYNAASADLTVTGSKAAQTITFAALADTTSAARPTALNATASSSLPVSFTLVSGPATLSGTTLTLTGAAGTVVVRATQPGNDAFAAALDVERSFNVTFAAAAPVITSQPTAQTALVGGSATFAVVATGRPEPTYLWRKNSTAITGATGASLTLANVAVTDEGSYDVVVTNSAGSVTSGVARLVVASAPVAPVITRQPGGATARVGRGVGFEVVASGTPAPTYQWRKDGAALAGATGSSLSLASTTSADAGTYSVVVSNSAGSVTSAGAALRVIARSYAGTYFGTLSNGGSFALVINDDNTGVFLGYAPGSRTAYVSRAVVVDDNGNFSFAISTTTGAASIEGIAGDPLTAAAVDDLVVGGSISSTGSLSASSTGGASLSLTATKSADTGTGSSVAGFYSASAAGSSAQTLAIVSPSGQAFVLTQNGTSVDAGTGTVDATGRVAVTTAGQQTVVANLSTTGSLAATVTDAKGATTTFTGFNAATAAAAEQRIVNISTRTTAGAGADAAIVGFVVTGLESKTVLIRAVGPTLRTFGVTTALAVPRLDLARGTTTIETNTGWSTARNTAEIAAAAARCGAFALTTGSADSVILTTLAPGSYSAIVSASDGRAGVALVEVYDLSSGSAAQRLANLSTRANVGSGDATLISGLVVTGSAPKRMLIRAAGPALTQFGVAGALARPQLTLFSGTTTIAQNAGWSTSADAAAIAEGAARAGAFTFATGRADAAMIVNLAPGAYTAQVTGVNNTTGIALVEIYELP